MRTRHPSVSREVIDHLRAHGYIVIDPDNDELRDHLSDVYEQKADNEERLHDLSGDVRVQLECEIRADVWRDAARIARLRAGG